MAEYKVTWEIDVDGDSPRDAANKAMEIQRDPDSIATVFKVTDSSGTETEIDLMEKPDDSPGPG